MVGVSGKYRNVRGELHTSEGLSKSRTCYPCSNSTCSAFLVLDSNKDANDLDSRETRNFIESQKAKGMVIGQGELLEGSDAESYNPTKMYRKSRRKYGSCFLWLRRCAQFACSVCKASYSCANHIGSGKPWWTSTRLTVFGLREDGRTWEKCVVANEHLEEVYKPPPWWKRLLLKLRAGTRRADCLNPCSHWQSHQNAFCYDPVSYALNFDDSAACMQHHHHEVCCPHGAPISGALDSDEE